MSKKINRKDSSQFANLMSAILDAMNSTLDADLSILLGNAYNVLLEMKGTIDDMKVNYDAKNDRIIALQRLNDDLQKEADMYKGAYQKAEKHLENANQDRANLSHLLDKAQENEARAYIRLADEEMRHVETRLNMVAFQNIVNNDTERLLNLEDARSVMESKLRSAIEDREASDNTLRDAVLKLMRGFAQDANTNNEAWKQYSLGANYAATLIYNIIK